MKTKFRLVLFASAVCAFGAIFGAQANAQATRTWVSGVGDDANPCSRTAPCKTFAGAISKTAAGGEIDALDAGGFGAVTIAKSITINGTGTLGSILSSGVNGINVVAGATDIVRIRYLSINGAGTTLGTNGITYQSGGHLEVENCDFSNFSVTGISMTTTATSRLSVINSQFFMVANAININPVSGTAIVSLDNISVQGSTNGLNVVANAIVTISNSVIAHNAVAGISTAGAVQVNAESVKITNNGTGINAAGTSTVRMSNLNIFNNTIGLSNVAGATIASYLNNKFGGNTTQGSPTLTLANQ